jgi:hypothetical protein
MYLTGFHAIEAPRKAPREAVWMGKINTAWRRVKVNEMNKARSL